MDKETQEKINQLQLIEHNMHNISSQKQQFHNQLLEIESALSELKDRTSAFKIIGNIMVETEKAVLEQDLQSKKETIELRIKTFEKQEEKFKKKAEELQQDVLSKIKRD